MKRPHFTLFWLILLLSGCLPAEPRPANPTSPTQARTELILPSGTSAVPLVTGLSGPTQFIFGPNGRLWVAQLASGENDGAGELLAIDLNSGAREVLLTGLDKPTGIAIVADALWIAEENRLLRAMLDENGRPQPAEPILTNLPNNGRSNGTLTVTPDGFLLYETSGRRQGNQAAANSGILWQLDPQDPTNPMPLASGLKNAYAHAFDENGRLFTTEIGDGAVEGADFSGQPPEEINLIVTDGDYGWPVCFGDRETALNRDGTAEGCAATERPLTLLPPKATPTGLTVSPFEPDTLLVALWVEREVWQVTLSEENGRLLGQAEPWITGFANPQHLLVTPQGTLLVSDYGRNVIYEIRE
jgi:glucose/arabinose dehydrogenase